MALWRLHAQMVRNGAASHKIDYVPQVQGIINSKENLNGIVGLKETVIFAEWVYFAYLWICIGKGLRSAA